MLRSFQNLLVSLNHTSGKRIWWIPYTIGMSLIAIWIGAALPWADLITGSMVGIGQFGGAGSVTTMIAYGHEITSITADFYFLAIRDAVESRKQAQQAERLAMLKARRDEQERWLAQGNRGYLIRDGRPTIGRSTVWIRVRELESTATP